MLVKWLNDEIALSYWELGGLCAITIIVPMIATLFLSAGQTNAGILGVRYKTMLSVAIYRKSLRLSSTATKGTSTGNIVNIMSNDANNLVKFMEVFHALWSAPIIVLGAITWLVFLLGWSGVVGVAFLVVLFPIQGFIFGVAFKLRRAILGFTDQRVSIMNEVLVGMQIVKFYNWEEEFLKKIDGIRKGELKKVIGFRYAIALGISLVLLSAPLIQPVIVFSVHVALGNELNAATAFTAIVLFNVMRLPFTFLPIAIQQFLSVLVSLRRIIDFISKEELTEDNFELIDDGRPKTGQNKHLEKKTKNSAANAFEVVDAVFTWDESEQESKAEESTSSAKKQPQTDTAKAPDMSSAVDMSQLLDGEVPRPKAFQLGPITAAIPRGKLTAIVGPVGSGKSSLIAALTGEMAKVHGQLLRTNEICALCAQKPCVLNDTFRGQCSHPAQTRSLPQVSRQHRPCGCSFCIPKIRC